MAKNERGTWVGTTTQPSFQSYPTAGMLQQGSGSGTPTAPPPTTAPPPPPPPVTPPPTTLPPLTPTLPYGTGTLEGGGYGNINVPPNYQPPGNDYYSLPEISAPYQAPQEPLGPGPVLPELPIPAPRLKLIDAVMEKTSGPQIGAANNSTLRNGVGGLYNIRRNY